MGDKDIRLYQSSSCTCSLTGDKIETMEPHLRLFGSSNIPIKINNEVSVYDKMKHKLDKLSRLEKEPHGFIMQQTEMPCDTCKKPSEKNVLLHTNDEEYLMESFCISCLNDFCSRIEKEIKRYHGSCVYYDSAGVSIHDYSEELTVNNILEGGESKISTFIKIGRDDVGERTSVFPISDMKKVNGILQDGRKSRFVKKNYKDYNCDTCSSNGDGPHYKIGRNPDIIWNVIILCEDCLGEMRDSFEEIIEMDELMAYII